MTFGVKVIDVHQDDLEQLGTKEKFWCILDGERNLFKFSRDNTGEHWSEKIAEALCHELVIPHAKYNLAQINERMGVLTPNVIPEDCRMIMGNEVLHNQSPSHYPKPKKNNQQFVSVKEHTISRVLACLDKPDMHPPFDWDVADLNAADVFCGYIMLDALISNQDRHHENWAIVIDGKSKKKYLCVTYDHAASLGRELRDKDRANRLTTKDKNRQIEYFVKRARSELFEYKTDKKPLFTVDAFFKAVEGRKKAKLYWLNKLNELTEDKICEIFNNVPPTIISNEAKEFALRMVLENKKRLLTDDRA